MAARLWPGPWLGDYQADYSSGHSCPSVGSASPDAGILWLRGDAGNPNSKHPFVFVRLDGQVNLAELSEVTAGSLGLDWPVLAGLFCLSLKKVC